MWYIVDIREHVSLFNKHDFLFEYQNCTSMKQKASLAFMCDNSLSYINN